MKNLTKISFFKNKLLLWHKNDNKRTMPWKENKDPYYIWLSEIILQQTRVEQGLAYYNKFITNYPTINKLALADENSVFKLWEGLGYYSRCKNLIATARFIAFELAGKFPTDYDTILQLKGVGPYTAAAIASFAYNLPYAVVDGNVFRVLARYFGNHTAIDSNIGKKEFTQLAQTLLPKGFAALYNQAIMDFGATICKPKLPLCIDCIFGKTCIAYNTKTVHLLPIKNKKLIKTTRYFYYIVAEYQGNFYVKKRTDKDIWQNLWEFIIVEKDKKLKVEEFLTDSDFLTIVGKKSTIKSISPIYKQQLTHQTIEAVFIHIQLNKPLNYDGYTPILLSKIRSIAFPRLITNYFEKQAQIASIKMIITS